MCKTIAIFVLNSPIVQIFIESVAGVPKVLKLGKDLNIVQIFPAIGGFVDPPGGAHLRLWSRFWSLN